VTIVWAQLELTEQLGRVAQDESKGARLRDLPSAGDGDGLLLLCGGHHRGIRLLLLGRWRRRRRGRGQADAVVAAGAVGAAGNGIGIGIGGDSLAGAAAKTRGSHRVQRCQGIEFGS